MGWWVVRRDAKTARPPPRVVPPHKTAAHAPSATITTVLSVPNLHNKIAGLMGMKGRGRRAPGAQTHTSVADAPKLMPCI